MSRKVNVRHTAYGDYVNRQVWKFLTINAPNFTIGELAAFAGLKVTPSLRKRLWTMQQEGKIEACPFVGDDGRMHICYCKAGHHTKAEDLPF